MKQKKTGRKTNWWKWGFLLILAMNLAFVGVVASRLLQVREPATENISNNQKKSIKVGTFSTNIEQLNDTVAAYLKDYQTKKMSYNVYATSSEIMFEGKYTLLGYEVPYFVEVLPDESAININIQNLKNDADIYLKATTVDLVGDQFNFDIYKKSR